MISSKCTNVNCYVKNMGNVLHAVLKSAWLDIAEEIIDHPLFAPNVQDLDGNSFFHLLFENYIATSYKLKVIFKKLISINGCNPNIRNKYGLTPLHYAAKNNQADYIKLCIEHNTESTKGYKFDFDAIGGQSGYSVLHYLVIYSTIRAINDVLTYGVNVLAKDHYGRTARDIINHSIGKKLLLRFEKKQKREMTLSKDTVEILKKETLKAREAGTMNSCRKTDDRETEGGSLISGVDIKKKRGSVRYEDYSTTPRIRKNMLKKPEICRYSSSSRKPVETDEDHAMQKKDNLMSSMIKISPVFKKYSKIYTGILNAKYKKFVKYRLENYIFSKYDRDAEVSLKELSKKIANRSLRDYATHLYQVLKEFNY